MKSIQVNKDGVLGRKEREKDRERKIWEERERNTMVRDNGVGKWRGLMILTIGLNQQHLRMFAEGVNQIEQ
jgi:hypothetical protein